MKAARHLKTLRKTWILVPFLLIGLVSGQFVPTLLAQTNCLVSGVMFNTDSSPATNAQIAATLVERNGSSFMITPIVLVTDATGATVFSAPQGSTVWVAASWVGRTTGGDIGITIPTVASADLNILAITAKAPISGVTVSSGSDPVMSLTLPDFGISLSGAPSPAPASVQSVNGRTGAVTITPGDISAALTSVPMTAGGQLGVSGGLLYSTVSALSSVTDAAVGRVLTSGGVGAAPTWTATPTLSIDGSGNSTFLRAALSDHGAAGHYNFAVGYGDNPGDANRGDHVLSVGYNTAPAGGRANAAEPSFEWRIEDYYAPGGAAPGPYVEAHWQYYDALGRTFRPLAMQIDRTNGGYLKNATVNITSTGFSYLGINDVQYVKFAPGETMLLNGDYLDSYTNGQQFLRQVKADGGSLVPLVWLNRQDELVFGDNIWRIPTSTGHLLTSADNRIDIGTATANRPRTGYFGTSIVTPVFQVTSPLVAVGGGATSTLGAIGNQGPTIAAQNGWMRALDSVGSPVWIPVWK